jgi:hypothetical protein
MPCAALTRTLGLADVDHVEAERLLGAAVIKRALSDATAPSVAPDVRADACAFLAADSPALRWWIDVAQLDTETVIRGIRAALESGKTP